MQHWNETIMLHPIFSLGFQALFYKAESVWRLEKSGSKQYSMQYKQLLFLSLLHTAEVIHQEYPCLPSPRVVEIYFGQLLDILSWKHEVNSEHANLPRIRISKYKDSDKDPFLVVESWVAACEVCRDEWENKVREHQKKAREKAKILAMRNIKRQHYQDISLRRLWNWFGTQVPQFAFEQHETLESLFFTTEDKIHLWDLSDIDVLDSLLIRHCEIGNSISHEVTKRLNQLRQWHYVYTDTFEIVIDGDRFAEHRAKPEPTPKEFANRAQFLVAHAKWTLANRAGKEGGEL